MGVYRDAFAWATTLYQSQRIGSRERAEPMLQMLLSLRHSRDYPYSVSEAIERIDATGMPLLLDCLAQYARDMRGPDCSKELMDELMSVADQILAGRYLTYWLREIDVMTRARSDWVTREEKLAQLEAIYGDDAHLHMDD